MYKIILIEKPKHCKDCPLRGMYTKDCGTIRACGFGSAGLRYDKEPDARCKIKPHKVEAHNGERLC